MARPPPSAPPSALNAKTGCPSLALRSAPPSLPRAAQVDIYDQNTHLANHYLGGAAVPLTLGDDSHFFGTETSEEYDFTIEEVRRTEPRVSPLSHSLCSGRYRTPKRPPPQCPHDCR